MRVEELLALVFLCLAALFMPKVAAGETLIVAFGSHNAEPYAFIEQGQLSGGIIRDIMDEVGKELAMEVRYLNVPRKRMESYLRTGKAHLRLLANPRWVSEPEQYRWSLPLFRELDIFVVSATNAFPITAIDDLQGKRVGTILGYRYPKLMEKFAARQVFRDDVKCLEANFLKLKEGRIDCLVDSEILISYYLRKNRVQKDYVVGEMRASSHDVRAMLSRQLPVPFERIDAAFKKLRDSGKIRQILDSYR